MLQLSCWWVTNCVFQRFPDGGESTADVYDRVSSFFESMYRHWETHVDIDNYVIVCHGLTIATFFMRFFKYDVDCFNSYKNFTNCKHMYSSILLMSLCGR